jgi:hypothetical protein
MNNLWATLVPLIVGSALVPVQLLITILLIARSRATALAWVAGMTAVRLVQGVLFGVVLASDDVPADSTAPGPVASTLLLVAGLLFLLTALEHLIRDEDPDAPPPRWMATVDGLSPSTAFLFGAGVMMIGAKFWVFTLSAIAAIADADLGRQGAASAFALFAVLAVSSHLALIGVAYVAPRWADTVLVKFSDWLASRNRELMIGIGAVFGTWFVVKALDGFGVI